mmetsp:Transcript_60209/g.138124  ORF Transcript_60209/g.138124 Transcript_60209/m.138124 type:complete len:212 (+) Transcript_60209:3001-3636(+)
MPSTASSAVSSSEESAGAFALSDAFICVCASNRRVCISVSPCPPTTEPSSHSFMPSSTLLPSDRLSLIWIMWLPLLTPAPPSSTRAPKPTPSMAATSASGRAVPRTRAILSSSITSALATPLTAHSTLCTLATQCPHIIPSTTRRTSAATGVSRAPKPIESTASMSLSNCALPSTIANESSSETLTLITEGTACSAASTLATQWGHVIPSI